MNLSTLSNKGYTGGYHAFKKILRVEENGSKVIGCSRTGWAHFSSDYISSAIVNPDGRKVIYCLPLDIDIRGTDKKWLDREGRIDWNKVHSFLLETYPSIFKYTRFGVRSTAGKGVHIGIGISPIVRDGSDGSNKTLFLAKQAQVALIRLLNHHGVGADSAAVGIERDLPNFRRHEVSKFSQAKQLYYNKDLAAQIKRDKINVLSEILAVTNKLKECRVPSKKDDESFLHPQKTTEARLAKLYLDLFDNLGQSKCYSMAELVELTEISRGTLRNILVRRPKSRPKWLQVSYLGKVEGYELWLNPEYGCVQRAARLVENPEYASLFFKDLKLPDEVEDGERNKWLSSSAIHLKWHGYAKEQTIEALKAQAEFIPGHKESRSCKNIPRIVESVYRNQPQLFGIRAGQELPLALRVKLDDQKNVEGPQRGSASEPLSQDCELTQYSLAFTRRGNEKILLVLESIHAATKIISSHPVKGTGYKLQLGAIQDALRVLETKPGKLIVKGNSMLQGNPVTKKFAKFYGLEFKFEQRTAEDKRLIKEFREESPRSGSSMSCDSKPNLSRKVEKGLKNSNLVLELMDPKGQWGSVFKGCDNSCGKKVSCCLCCVVNFGEDDPKESIFFSVCQRDDVRNIFKTPESNKNKGLFRFPSLTEKVVRCDGYIGYLSNYYWLGESWIKRKLQVLDDGENVEFYEKGMLICTYEKLKGRDLKTGGSHQPWARAKFKSSFYRKKALSVGPNFDRLVVHQIVKGDGIIQTNKIFAFLSLMDSWPYEQLEAVASYCVRRGNFTNRFFKSCLESGVE